MDDIYSRGSNSFIIGTGAIHIPSSFGFDDLGCGELIYSQQEKHGSGPGVDTFSIEFDESDSEEEINAKDLEILGDAANADLFIKKNGSTKQSEGKSVKSFIKKTK